MTSTKGREKERGKEREKKRRRRVEEERGREIERLRDGGRRRMGKERELKGTKERICRATVIPSKGGMVCERRRKVVEAKQEDALQ